VVELFHAPLVIIVMNENIVLNPLKTLGCLDVRTPVKCIHEDLLGLQKTRPL